MITIINSSYFAEKYCNLTTHLSQQSQGMWLLGLEVEISCPVGNFDEAIPPVERQRCAHGNPWIFVSIFFLWKRYLMVPPFFELDGLFHPKIKWKPPTECKVQRNLRIYGIWGAFVVIFARTHHHKVSMLLHGAGISTYKTGSVFGQMLVNIPYMEHLGLLNRTDILRRRLLRWRKRPRRQFWGTENNIGWWQNPEPVGRLLNTHLQSHYVQWFIGIPIVTNWCRISQPSTVYAIVKRLYMVYGHTFNGNPYPY